MEQLERAMASERRGTWKGAGRCAYETDRPEEEKDTPYQSYDNSMLLKSSSANMFCRLTRLKLQGDWTFHWLDTRQSWNLIRKKMLAVC
jgi:hypothetical protein